MAKRTMGIICILLALCFCLMPCRAQAVSTADADEFIVPDQLCSLTIRYRGEAAAISGMSVKLYKIAEVSADFRYTPIAPFDTFGLSLDGIQSNAEWNIIRATLEANILAGNLPQTCNAVTDSNGNVHFESLKPGLYLAIPDHSFQKYPDIYFESALIALPGLDADGLWQYQVEVTAKPEILPPVEPDDVITFKILKLWRGDDGQARRPVSIEAEIFRNGKSHQTVILSEKNQWSYSWTAVADNATWTVVERNIPAGYTMTVEKRDTTFLLTNTLIPETPKDIPPTSPPKTGDTPHILLYTMIMYVSGIGLILAGISGKRKRA